MFFKNKDMKENILPQIEQIRSKTYDIIDLTDNSQTKKGIKVNQTSKIIATITKELMRILEDD